MKLKLVALVYIVLAVYCIKSSSGNPIEDLTWLKAKQTELSKNCTCIPSIWQHSFENRTIYETGCNGPACYCIHFYYEANGLIVVGSKEANRQVFLPKLSNRKLLWSCQ